MRFARFAVAMVIALCALVVLAGPAFLVVAAAVGAEVYVRGGMLTVVLNVGLGAALLVAARRVAFR